MKRIWKKIPEERNCSTSLTITEIIKNLNISKAPDNEKISNFELEKLLRKGISSITNIANSGLRVAYYSERW